MEMQNFKFFISGDASTGKTFLLRRFLSSIGHEVEDKYADFHTVQFSSNLGLFKINFYDPKVKELYGCIDDSIYKNINCAMIVFDHMLPHSYENILYWYSKITSFNGRIPIVLCGNNAHSKSRKILPEKVNQDWGSRINYFETSAHSAELINEPFLFLIKKLFKNGDLKEIAKFDSETNLNINSLHDLIDAGEKQNNEEIVK